MLNCRIHIIILFYSILFRDEDERHCCCPVRQQHTQARRKPCNAGYRTQSRPSRHSRQQPSKKEHYSEIRRKLIEELERELKDQSDAIGNITKYDDFEQLNHSGMHEAPEEDISAPPSRFTTDDLPEITGTPIDEPGDTAALVIQVPNNVNKIVLERNGQKITVEL